MEAERPVIVDRQGRHLIWDGSSSSWVNANQDMEDQESFGRVPESMSGLNPAYDSEVPGVPREDFGTFSSFPEHGIEEVPTDNYNREGDHDFNRDQTCENCGAELDGDGDCNDCGHSQYDPGGRFYEGPDAQLFPHLGPFSERVPKMNYLNQGDNGATSSVHQADFDFSAPAPVGGPPAGGLDFSNPGGPSDGGPDDKTETHRFVIDRTGRVVMEPATFEHHEIVAKHGLDEAARGSVYRNGTADVHRSWVPINAPELERTLGQQLGQQSVPLNFYPGMQEGMTEGNTARGVPMKAVQGYIWKQEHGVPDPRLAQTVPLIFAAEHTTPDDFPAYQNAKGFLTATGGGASHAAVESRQRGMGGALGIGADYNKAVHGAPVSIRDDGTVEFGQADPDSIVSQYFQRTPEDWAAADEARRQKLHDYYMRTPEWQRPNRGGSVIDKTNDDYAIEAMTFGPRIAASLDECPECGDVMVDRNGEKQCANCGHVQKIIMAEAGTKTAIDLNPLDAAKGVGQFAIDHPLETAGAIGLGALAIPTGGADLALAPEVEGGLAAADAGATAAEGAGVAGEAGTAGEGAAAAEEGAAAEGQAPGRMRSLLNKAKGVGQGALVSQGINSFLNGMNGGGQQAGQQQDYEGVIARYGDPRFDFWQFEASDDDGLDIAGIKNDGDDVTDEQTQGAMEDHGGTASLDDFLRDLGDTGSANYGPEQRNAVDHFNNNLPIIVELAKSDNDESEHPVIKELERLMEAAGWGGKHEHEHGESDHSTPPKDVHQDEHQEEAHEADKDFPKAAAAHRDGCDCGFCTNMRKNMGQEDDDMEKESATHWSVMDMDEREIEALFAGEPVNKIATMPVGPSGAGPEQTSHEQCPNCGAHTFGKFCHECGTPTQSGHLQSMQANRVAKPAEHNPNVNPQAVEGVGDAWEHPEDGDATPHELQRETLGDAILGNARQSAPPVTPERTIPGPDSAVDKGQPIVGTDGSPIQEGQTYLMKSPQYSVPDEVKILKLKPNPSSPTHVQVEVKHQMPNGEHFSFPNEIDLQEIAQSGLTFEPLQQASPQVEQEALRGAQPDETPDAGQVTDLSGTPDSMPSNTGAFEGEGDFIDGLNEPVAEDYEPTDGLMYTGPNGEPVSYQQYAASLRAEAPPHLAWLWDNVEAEVEVSERQREFARITAGKDFTHLEQRQFINEPGEARNKDKLDLEGTHYLEHDSAAPDDELWFY